MHYFIVLFAASKSGFDRDVEKKFDQMLLGDLSDLPHLPRSIVRIFLSSTFSGGCAGTYTYELYVVRVMMSKFKSSLLLNKSHKNCSEPVSLQTDLFTYQFLNQCHHG
jgi:hypothetical protein